MERIPSEVMCLLPRRRTTDSRVFCLHTLFILCFTLSSASLSQPADILIVERPENLSVFDGFQKSLSGTASVLRPFAPLKVLSHELLLNDGITKTMKVEHEKNVFYLLYGEKNILAGSPKLGMTKIFRRKTLFQDTLEILAPTTFQSPHKTSKSSMTRGTLCVRYFADAGFVYVKPLDDETRYGWTLLSGEGKSWRVVRPAAAKPRLSPDVIQRLNRRVREANRTLADIFSLLGLETGKRALSPQWRVDSARGMPTYVLEPAIASRTYARSIAALTITMQTYLLGTDFDAVAVNNRIEIRRR